MKINSHLQQILAEAIEVNDPECQKSQKKEPKERACLVNRACDPEPYFDMIEKCKKCGRCV